MYKIAVCEDEPEVLRANFEQDSRAFDFLFLDILMGDGMSGMELAKKLRSRGVSVAIAFVTSSEEFLREGYRVQPVNYLFKPAGYKDVLDVIQTARRSGASQTAVFRSGQTMLVLELSKIIYSEVYDHKIHIYPADGERVVSGSLSSMRETLPDELFARCHNSYLINLSYVTEVTRTAVFLRGGLTVPVSRNYYESFRIALVKYLS